MTGTPKKKLNKIRMEMMKRHKEVAQDGVETTASQLRGEDWLAKWTKQRGHDTSKSREQKNQRRLIWDL